MLKQISNRITYAQEKIIQLIKERKLRQWCADNGLSHSALYRIGIGDYAPSYKYICSMAHLIAPIEWLFFTDEELPFPPQVVPQWNPENRCKFIKQHKSDYKEIAKKYGISELSAYNICVSFRAMPSLPFIRECCKDTNPIDFFTDGEEPETPELFVPDRGDIINIQENLLLVLSSKTRHTNKLICTPILNKSDDTFLELIDTKVKGFVDTNNIKTYLLTSRCQAKYIETISSDFTDKIIQEVRRIFD